MPKDLSRAKEVCAPRPTLTSHKFQLTQLTRSWLQIEVFSTQRSRPSHTTKMEFAILPRNAERGVFESLSKSVRSEPLGVGILLFFRFPTIGMHVLKWDEFLARSPLQVALVGRKMTVVKDQLFPQKPPGSRFRFSRKGVQPSPGSSTIELPSAFAESVANDRSV